MTRGTATRCTLTRAVIERRLSPWGLRLRRISVLPIVLLLATVVAPAYYHYVHIERGPLGTHSMVERFDLAALVDDTLYFYVSAEQRPRLQSNDSFEGLVSQVRQALAVWDAVPTSRLRIGFGGIVDGPLPGRGPAGEIVFAELPPGVIGLGGPVLREQPRDGFVPIIRSQVIVSNDLVGGSRPRQSFSELFYNALVHEIGHAIGLQHTLAGAAMSMDATRATTRAQPLTADDIAGLSSLYPTAELARLTGAISGQVSFGDGSPVNLASVGAIHRSGRVVTALTRPDGEYRIEGLLPGEYRLYVQPLPPSTRSGLGPANVILPLEASGGVLPASPAFHTVFFAAGDRPENSPPVRVFSSQVAADVDFRVRRREQIPLYNITTFSFPGNGAPGIHPAFLNLTEDAGLLVATGPGLLERLDSVQVEPLGRDIAISPIRPYPFDERFAALDFQAAPFSGFGPLHLLFRLPGDLYVLPGAVQLTDSAAPVIHWISPDFSRPGMAWRVRGEHFHAASQVYFDGLPGFVLEFDSGQGEIVVEPPPGPTGHRAIVTVYNPDGQSSAFTLPDGNVMFEYEGGPRSEIRVFPAVAEADTDVVVEIAGSFSAFAPGETAVGFGSSDILTRRVVVLDGNRARAVLSIRDGAEPGAYDVSVVNGLEVVVLPAAFRIEAPTTNARSAPALRYGGLVNSATNTADLAPGVLASLFGADLAAETSNLADGARVRVTFNGVPARILSVSATQINLQVPESLRPGAVELRVFNGQAESAPMLVEISRVAPGLFRALRSDGRPASADAPAAAGDTLEILATGLGALSAQEDLGLLRLEINGLRLTPSSVSALSDTPGVIAIRVRVPERLSGVAISVSVLIDGRRSNVLRIPLAAAPAPRTAS